MAMRSMIVLLLVASCTKPNPDRCCVDAADCAANAITNPEVCGDGLVCRGNQCIAEQCSTSSECDASAPYCIADMGGRCSEMCTDSSQCPGSGQATDELFCDGGACVECRSGMDDCAAAAPVCDSGSCRTCASNAECASGVCAADGSCADETSIAFVTPLGSDTSPCTSISPCSLGHGLSLAVPYVLLANGTYALATTQTVKGTTSLIGAGSTMPIVMRTTAGTIFSIAPDSQVTFSNLEISGAVPSGSGFDGVGIDCPVDPTGARKVILIDTVLANNVTAGLQTRDCTFSAMRSTFQANGFGIAATDSTGTIDRCTADANTTGGFDFDGGMYALTNSFIVHNLGFGVSIFSEVAGNQIEFNTVVDNTGMIGTTFTVGIECDTSLAASFPNNIIARNKVNTSSGMCTYPGSIISADVTALHFLSPDVAPFDYHIDLGSSAIDQATVSTVDHDFDGDARPQGAGKDIGADELKQP